MTNSEIMAIDEAWSQVKGRTEAFQNAHNETARAEATADRLKTVSDACQEELRSAYASWLKAVNSARGGDV